MFHKRTSTSTKRKFHLPLQNANQCRTTSKQKTQISTNRMCRVQKKEHHATKWWPLQTHCFLQNNCKENNNNLPRSTRWWHVAATFERFALNIPLIGWMRSHGIPRRGIRSYKGPRDSKSFKVTGSTKKEQQVLLQKLNFCIPAASRSYSWNQLLGIFFSFDENALCLHWKFPGAWVPCFPFVALSRFNARVTCHVSVSSGWLKPINTWSFNTFSRVPYSYRVGEVTKHFNEMNQPFTNYP